MEMKDVPMEKEDSYLNLCVQRHYFYLQQKYESKMF